VSDAAKHDAASDPIRPSWVKCIFIVACWYVCSAISNNLSKHVLGMFPYPVTLSVVHFGMATLVGLSSGPMQWCTWSYLRQILPNGACMMVSHLTHRASLLHCSVSFVHSIKALAPVFSVILCYIVLQQRFSTLTYLSLIPIVIGVILASYTQQSFSLFGLALTVLSCVALCLNGVYTKRTMLKATCTKWEQMFATNAVTFLFFLPIWIHQDLAAVQQHMYDHPGTTPNILLMLVAVAGLMIVQQGLGFTLISMVTPVTYSVTNNMKRVFVILLGAAQFGTVLTNMNLLGIALFTAGVLGYSHASKMQQPAEGGTCHKGEEHSKKSV